MCRAEQVPPADLARRSDTVRRTAVFVAAVDRSVKARAPTTRAQTELAQATRAQTAHAESGRAQTELAQATRARTTRERRLRKALRHVR
ncbi:hypothetical protein KACC15558_33560 [Brevibacterium ammoniilyticum]|uniref:Uncharacterized protein n=1 Tax=Brevibacterium ammoniilyticum TaxID=1046555 RepID=A0ABP9U404_9MICO